MKYKYIIWDWNGTLFDDVKISVDTMNIMLEKTGYKNRINSELYKNIFTFPVSDYYQKAGFDFSKDRFDDLAKIYVEVYTALQFTAKINSEAAIGSNAGNTNTATLTYSNNPMTTDTGTTVPDEVKTYTYGLSCLRIRILNLLSG